MTANGTGTGQSTPSLARKVAYTAGMGLGTFVLSETLQGPLDVPLAQQLVLSALVGSVTLLTQFLHEFEQRITALEQRQNDTLQDMQRTLNEGFSSVTKATHFLAQVEDSPLSTNVLTELVQVAGKIGENRPGLLLALGQHELERATDLLRSLVNGHEVFYDGEDREWLLGLTRNAKRSIDATSLATVDAGPISFENGLWMSDLGGRYLDLQRAATARGVRIRRIFVMDDSPGLDLEDFEQTCELQHSSGVEVRRLDSRTIPAYLRSLIFDFVVFDGVLSYETTPAARLEARRKPAIVTTTLVLDAQRIQGRSERFEALWSAAVPIPLASSASVPSSTDAGPVPADAGESS